MTNIPTVSVHLSSLQKHVDEEEQVSFTRRSFLLNPSLIVRPRSGKTRGQLWKDSVFRNKMYEKFEEDTEEESVDFSDDGEDSLWNRSFKDTADETALQFSSSPPSDYTLSKAILIVQQHRSSDSLGTVSTDSEMNESRDEDEDEIFVLENMVEDRVVVELRDEGATLKDTVDDAMLCAMAKKTVYAGEQQTEEKTAAPKKSESVKKAVEYRKPAVDVNGIVKGIDQVLVAEKKGDEAREVDAPAMVHRMPRHFLCSDMELNWIMPVNEKEEDHNEILVEEQRESWHQLLDDAVSEEDSLFDGDDISAASNSVFEDFCYDNKETASIKLPVEVLCSIDNVVEIVLKEEECLEVTNLQHVTSSLKQQRQVRKERTHAAAMAQEQYLLDTSWLDNIFALDKNCVQEDRTQLQEHRYLYVQDCNMEEEEEEDSIVYANPAFDIFCGNVSSNLQDGAEGVEVVGLAVHYDGLVEV